MNLLWLLCLMMDGEVLDRVAVSIGTQVITESELIEEIKITSFLNREAASFTSAAKRAAADRLIEQKLVRKEMELGSYPPASAEEVDAMLDKLEKTRARSRAAFDRELESAALTREELKRHLSWGLTLAHFIDVRFRPAVQVTRRDVEKYYREKLLPSYGPGQKPSLDDVRMHIEQTLAAERSDQQMDAWLKDARARSNIVYHKEVFGDGPNQPAETQGATTR